MTHYYTDNKDLDSRPREFDYYFANETFRFTTDIGVFSKGGVDRGSQILLKTIYKRDLGVARCRKQGFIVCDLYRSCERQGRDQDNK